MAVKFLSSLKIVQQITAVCIVVGLVVRGSEATEHILYSRKLAALVPSPSPILDYHNGALLTGPSNINIYVLWYGTFSPAQKSIVNDFISSFNAAGEAPPSVTSWWKTSGGYKDESKASVSSSLSLSGQFTNSYSLAKNLKRADIASLVEQAVTSSAFPLDPSSIYLVLTAEDVFVEDFCMNSCGFHDHSSSASSVTNTTRLIYAWVGNSATQCPGLCAWPYANPEFESQTTKPLISPNNDVGMDGIVMNIATILAGAATNPFGDGYFQGDARAPLEAVSACAGMFGKGAYPGYPGSLFLDKTTGASYNANGANKRLFLLPAMWDPSSGTCITLS
eukprot:c27004_g2_i1 orf=291-1295(-)